MVTNSEQGNSLFSYFLFLKTSRHDMKLEPYFYGITSFTPKWASFGRVCFSLVVSLTSDLPHGSAGVCWCCGGLQVKPLLYQSGPSRPEATLRSWLNRTSAVCLPHAAFISLPDLQKTKKEKWQQKDKNIVLYFLFLIFICHGFCSGVPFSWHD